MRLALCSVKSINMFFFLSDSLFPNQVAMQGSVAFCIVKPETYGPEKQGTGTTLGVIQSFCLHGQSISIY